MTTFYIFPDKHAMAYYTEKKIQTRNSGIDLFIHTDITIMPGIMGILIPLGI